MSDALTRHLEFRAAAQALLKDDPDYSVWRQVVSMFWRDAAFRVFKTARAEATPSSAMAPLLRDYIDETYFEGAAIAISRLTDPPASERADLVSLPTVLETVRAHRLGLTRDLFVTFDGAPYDEASSDVAEGATESARRHALFDRLSGKKPGRRSRSDIVHRSVLAACRRRLETPAIARVRRLRRKVISHAADAGARRGPTRGGMTLADIDEAHRAILEVAETLSLVTLGEALIGAAAAATAATEALAGLEAPFALAADADRLQAAWTDHAAVREGWSGDALSEVLGR